MADSSTYSFSSPTGQTTRVPSLVEEYDENKSKVDVEARNDQEIIDDSREINEKLPSPTESSSSHSKVDPVGPPPDGGLRAWLVVLGATCAGFCTFGFANAFGVFQAYYTRTIPGATQFSIAWIGSLQYCLIFLPGLLAGHIADIGYLRHMLAIAAMVLITSIFLVPECTTLWQLILCQGIAVGGASGFLFMPSVGVVSQYFLKKRSTAFGCTALGSSLGGTILPIALRKLMTAVGFKWTIRILGFIIATLLGVMVLCVRPRTAARKHRGWPPVLELLKIPALRYYTIGVSMMWLGIYNPLTYFDVYAQDQLHIPSSKSFYVIVTANASSLIGRLGSGIVADRLGALTVLTACCTSAAIITILWPYTTTFASLEVVAVLYGISSGAFVSLLPAPSSHMVEPHQMGATIGLTSTCMALGALVSSPIAGQILDTAGGLNFAAVGGYSGGIALFACLFCLASRHHALQGWRGKF